MVDGRTASEPSMVEVAADIPRSRLLFRTKAGYGLGEAVSGIVQTATDSFLLFYLTAVLGLSGSLAGAALFFALIVDSVADPLIGYTSDNSRSRWGRRHPFIIGSIVPLSLAVGTIFSLPHISNHWLLFAEVAAIILTLRICLSLYALPFIALGAELTRDYGERSTIQAYRTFFWIVAYGLVFVLGLDLFMGGNNGLLYRPGYIGFGWTCAAILASVGLLSAFETFNARPPLPRVVSARGSVGLRRLWNEVSEVMRNSSFLALFLTVMFFWIAQGIANSLWLHSSKYFWHLPASVIQTMPMLTVIGFAVGIPITALLLMRFEKKTVAVVSCGLISLIQIIPATLEIVGLFPTGGQALFVLLYGFQFLLGVTTTTLGITFPSMMADAADEHELLFGSRREGLYFAGLTLSAKAASGVGAFAAGLGLDAIGFPSNLASAGSIHLAPDIVRHLGFIWGPVAGAISLISAITLMRYDIDRRELGRIQSELRIRHAVADGVL